MGRPTGGGGALRGPVGPADPGFVGGRLFPPGDVGGSDDCNLSKQFLILLSLRNVTEQLFCYNLRLITY